MGTSIRRDHKFPNALRAAMKSHKMTRADLARELGVARTTVYGWLSGSEPGEDNFRKLVRVFPELSEFTRG